MDRDLEVLAWPAFLACPSPLKNQSTRRESFLFCSLLLNLSCIKLVGGNSLVVQWLGLGAFTAGVWVRSLVGELRSCKVRKKKKRKKKLIGLDDRLTMGGEGKKGTRNDLHVSGFHKYIANGAIS